MSKRTPKRSQLQTDAMREPPIRKVVLSAQEDARVTHIQKKTLAIALLLSLIANAFDGMTRVFCVVLSIVFVSAYFRVQHLVETGRL